MQPPGVSSGGTSWEQPPPTVPLIDEATTENNNLNSPTVYVGVSPPRIRTVKMSLHQGKSSSLGRRSGTNCSEVVLLTMLVALVSSLLLLACFSWVREAKKSHPEQSKDLLRAKIWYIAAAMAALVVVLAYACLRARRQRMLFTEQVKQLDATEKKDRGEDRSDSASQLSTSYTKMSARSSRHRSVHATSSRAQMPSQMSSSFTAVSVPPVAAAEPSSTVENFSFRSAASS